MDKTGKSERESVSCSSWGLLVSFLSVRPARLVIERIWNEIDDIVGF